MRWSDTAAIRALQVPYIDIGKVYLVTSAPLVGRDLECFEDYRPDSSLPCTSVWAFKEVQCECKTLPNQMIALHRGKYLHKVQD